MPGWFAPLMTLIGVLLSGGGVAALYQARASIKNAETALLRAQSQNKVEEATQRETAKDSLIEYLSTQLEEERAYRRVLDGRNQELFQLLTDRTGMIEQLRKDFIRLDDANRDLMREQQRLQACDQARVAELEDVKAENQHLKDRVSLLEATLRENGLEIPTADRRRADAELGQQALEA
jgi:chromosome segregation ATPase